KYFNNNKNVYFLLPEGELSPEDREATGYRPDDILKVKLDPNTLRIVDDTEDGVGVQAYRKLKNNKSQHYCPCCNSENTVAIVGTKIPTLSSISVSQTLATDLNKAEEKDRKVLAFTNGVQDA